MSPEQWEAFWIVLVLLGAMGFFFGLGAGLIYEQIGLALFCMIALVYFVLYMPFFGETCLNGLLWGDCPVCPHKTLWMMATEHGVWYHRLAIIVMQICSVIWLLGGIVVVCSNHRREKGD